MAIEQRFLVIKNKDSKTIKYFEYDKLNGYSIHPKPNIKFSNAINVNKMIIINPSLIDKIIDRKIKHKFNSLINLLSFVYENEEASTPDGLELALNEAEKFRMEIINKYKQYLSEEKLNLLEKKLDILEDEIKLRMQYYINEQMNREFEEEKSKEGKSR